MSIIHNALKKTQNQLDKKNGDKTKIYETFKQSRLASKPTLRTSSPVSDNNPSSTSTNIRSIHTAKKTETANKETFGKKPILFILGTFLVGAGFFLAFLIFKKPSTTPDRSSPAPSYVIKETHYGNTVKLILNGTMMKGDKMIALINNEIYELGDSINGMKIENITLDGVELLNNGKIVTLRLRPKQK
ncbi:MAG TPA: hypothetical protein DD723_04030 [Candidatus Omnitrophica bacterium]|nr:MAG: hypothetical protein A2Z81_00270 [Omnitrophica WOR_2 bacterium GWA2_45_18]OGX19627.1 MAG: hypothetical protein A2Y04_02815 [Omnitrophica WOR_2 bacterium GWC2_45_7]HBR14699.1 hypothetical protein [Candidatus Omnitrophota bacterium]